MRHRLKDELFTQCWKNSLQSWTGGQLEYGQFSRYLTVGTCCLLSYLLFAGGEGGGTRSSRGRSRKMSNDGESERLEELGVCSGLMFGVGRNRMMKG